MSTADSQLSDSVGEPQPAVRTQPSRVTAVMSRARRITPAEARRMALCHAPDDVEAEAWTVALTAVRDAGLEDAYDRSVQRATDASPVNQRYGMDSGNQAAVDFTVSNTLLAAWAESLVGKHGLEQWHIDALWEPWVNALGDGWHAPISDLPTGAGNDLGKGDTGHD